MKKLFNDEQIKYIISNYETMKYSEIAKYLGNCNATQITGWLHNNGYKKLNRSLFSKEERDFMKSNYKSMTYKEIANILNYSERQIRGWINNNCEKKVRIFNENYFENIDNPNVAYWLGFIFADGWVCCNENNSNYELGIELQQSDRYHLENFNNELGGVHIIKDAHYERYILDNKNISITNSSTLRIYSKKIVEDLIKHGVVENKTLKTIHPKLDDYFYDFLRGYIDGDGCIYPSKNSKSVTVHITCATSEIFKYIQAKVYDDYKIKSYINKHNDRKYRLCFHGKEAMKLLDLLYYDNSVEKLDRKYQIYLLLKQRLSY